MLSVRRATVNYLIAGFDYWLFLSTPSVRRATLHLWPVLRSIRHFYPRPPRGGRPSSTVPCRVITSFLSTPSARRATIPGSRTPYRQSISIHALREEGDSNQLCIVVTVHDISIHALREEGDWAVNRVLVVAPKFLSTPSARRATCARCAAVSGGHISIHALREEGDAKSRCKKIRLPYFYPRPPRGGRPFWNCLSQKPLSISIHALREEGDFFSPRMYAEQTAVSIHALREEGDCACLQFSPNYRDFYPRPPRGGRRGISVMDYRAFVFLSTPSARRATRYPMEIVEDATLFLSTPSARRATELAVPFRVMSKISIHALREEGDLHARDHGLRVKTISIHALREEGDRRRCTTPPAQRIFLSTPSARRATRSDRCIP